ncbi:MAG: flagellar biosynthetic protein FliR [Caldimicrobium sp.]
MTQEILNLLEKNFFVFLLIFFRFIFLFFLFPLFASAYFPSKIKIALSLVLALSFTPLISIKFSAPQNVPSFITFLFYDFFLFFLLSLFFRYILAGLQLGGELVGFQMGFGISQTFDPMSGISMPILSQFIYLLFLLFFFTLDIHHHLIYFVVKSFEQLPPGTSFYQNNLIYYVIKKSGLIFDITVKVLAPLLVFMFMLNIILAIIGRLIPQINVLFVSFPLTLGIGLLFFGLMLILIPSVFRTFLGDFTKFLALLLRS